MAEGLNRAEEVRWNGDELPPCQLRGREPHDCGGAAGYDGKTIFGPWAHMCPEAFTRYGVGLGVGRGQRLVLRGEEPT